MERPANTCTYSDSGEFPLEIKNEFSELFSARDGVSAAPIKGYYASFTLKESAKPICCRARPVPYML
jgi:hypothetical protein